MLEEDISKDQDEMNEQFIQEYQEAYESGDFETFAENWGLGIEEAHKIALEMPQLDGFVPEDVTKSEEDTPDSVTRNGVTIDTSGDMDPMIENMGGAGATKLVKGMFARNSDKAAKVFKRDKVVTPRAGKAVQVKPDAKFTSGANSKHIVKNKNFDKPTTAKSTKPTQRQAELATAGGLTTALLLNGNRNEQGDFIEGPKEKVDLQQPKGIEQPEEAPEGNQFGYHQRPGQNFMTVNNDDAYWDTHEMGTGDAWSDADVKKVQQEVDWSNWF